LRIQENLSALLFPLPGEKKRTNTNAFSSDRLNPSIHRQNSTPSAMLDWSRRAYAAVRPTRQSERVSDTAYLASPSAVLMMFLILRNNLFEKKSFRLLAEQERSCTDQHRHARPGGDHGE
jgi:hypothetical protein